MKNKDIYRFECGCEFETMRDTNGQIIGLKYEPEKVRLDCPAAWEIVSDGKTLGCFQITTQLGKSNAHKLKPHNIDELAALVSIIRPGTLDAFIDGKSLTNHFIDRKNGKEEAVPLHPALTEITKDTQGILLYQESVLKAAQLLAGFSPVESRKLQKAMGKKLPELMAKVKSEFIAGCARVGTISREQAETVFDVIEANQRYSFNKCVSPQTLVAKEDGQLVALDEIEIGDTILDHNGDYTEVLDVIESGEQELYEFETDHGNIIQCTASHKFLCEDGEIREMNQILRESHHIMAID